MRVGFGATVLERGLAGSGIDGIGSYTRALMKAFEVRPELELLPFAYEGPVAGGDAGPLVRIGSFERQALVSLATGLPFPIANRRFAGAVDLVHATDHLIPRLRGVPVVATMMDAIPLAHPEWVTYRFKRVKNVLWSRTAGWARHVVTISEHSRHEISRWFRVPEERISVVPLGVGDEWFEAPSAERVAAVRARYTLPDRYFLFVGTLQPRKNLSRVIAAHRTLPVHVRQELPLVVVGRAGWACDEELACLTDGDRGALRWLQYVPGPDLLPLLGQAAALVLPSLHEGFGLPVLEAFAAGVPVITSNTTALPEVAGEAALLVNPTRTGEIADAMRLVASDATLVAQLRPLGRARARTFTWERTAQQTLAVYAKVLGAER